MLDLGRAENYRITKGLYGSTRHESPDAGAFIIPFKTVKLAVIASKGISPQCEGWDHVSVSLPNRCPNWEEMCFIKDLFWSVEDCVVQFHPPKSEYVNMAKTCLHLWRNPKIKFPMPPKILVGF